MPGFDPVRDAVLNSPISPSQPLPFPRPRTADAVPAYAFPMTSTTSPTLGRRATDLSVLLNDDPPPASPAPQTPLFTPTFERRGSTLSQILLPGSGVGGSHTDSKLSQVDPLGRRTSASSDQSTDPSYFSIRPSPPSAHTHSTSSPFAHSHPSNAITRSPIMPASRPSSSSSMTQRYDPVHAASNRPHHDLSISPTSMPPPPPPASTNFTPSPKISPAPGPSSVPPSRPSPPRTIPYAPVHRITPPTSVLIPLSKADIDVFNNLRGSHRLVKKRKRVELEFDEGEGQEGGQVKRKRSRDVGLIAEHYNARPDVGAKQRLHSPIIGLKAFNNWIKAVLIGRFAHRVLEESPWAAGGPRGPRGRAGGKVLDLGCGKGGDLTKWAKAKVVEYVGLDIAGVSIEQARARHASMSFSSRFPAFFAAVDCYTHPISSVVPPSTLSPPPPSRHPNERPNDGSEVFDVVSMQFCLHYAFESENKARCMLDNVSRYLRREGVFIGTVPNGEWLLDRLHSLPPDAPPSFGNSVYTIEFDDRRPKAQRPVFGDRYSFFLRDAVENVPEYVVLWDKLVSMAAEYRLYPIYKKEFHDVFQENQEHPDFGPLMVKMKVVDDKGESQMDEHQWEAANIYIAFAFEKR